ncbi:MAG: hypothetical protein EGQ63_07800, partial [Clostridiales bacterium]|nr:hypothetical protein [Clostridiales bacterium]
MKRKEKIRESMAYLREKKLADLKDELLIMKLSHLLSMERARNVILIGLDILFLFLCNYGTNIVKCSFQNIANITKGKPQGRSPLSIWNLIWYWNHSLVWWIMVFILIVIIV